MKNRISFIYVCVLLILSFSACSSLIYGFEDSDIVKPSKAGYGPVSSYEGDGLLTLSPSSEGYVFELYARYGSFRTTVNTEKTEDDPLEVQTVHIKTLTAESGYIVWTIIEPEQSFVDYSADVKTYIDVLIKKDGQYVGYAVVKVERGLPETERYMANILECKEITVEKAREKGLDREKLQELIDSVIEKDK